MAVATPSPSAGASPASECQSGTIAESHARLRRPELHRDQEEQRPGHVEPRRRLLTTVLLDPNPNGNWTSRPSPWSEAKRPMYLGHHARSEPVAMIGGTWATERSMGQSLVEFAIALRSILVFMLGLFDAGRAVIDYTTLTNAARTGARVAIVNQSNDWTCTSVRTFKCAAADQAVGIGVAAGAIPIRGRWIRFDFSGTCTVTVTVTHAMDMITPLIAR